MNYFNLTEIPEDDIPMEQLLRIVQRYSFSYTHSQNKNVLEIGSGPGIGANLLSKNAKSYKGIDVDKNLVEIALKNNPQINFETISDKDFFLKNHKKFDLIIIYETIYYIEDLKNLFSKIYDVLSSNGMLIICTANKNLLDFNSSIKTYVYPDILDIEVLSRDKFNILSYYGGIALNQVSFRQKILRPLKFLASKLNLIPKDMRGKKFLKKLFFGNHFTKMPKNIEYNEISLKKMKKLNNNDKDTKHKVLYFVLGKKN